MASNALARAPKPPEAGAILLHETSEFGNKGDWLRLEGNKLINLTARLPGNQRHQFASGSVGVSDVHYPLPIAGYLSEHAQRGRFLFDEFVQSQPVDHQQFKYRHFADENSHLLVDVRASAQSAPKEVTWSSELIDGETEDLRVGIFVSRRAVDQEDFPVLATSARKVWTAMALWREYGAFGSGGTFMTSGNWDAAVIQALGATYNWGPVGSAGINSDPIADLQAAHINSLEPIWAFGMNLTQFQWFSRHPLVNAHFESMNAGGTTAGMMSPRHAAAVAGDPNLTIPFEYNYPTVGRILVHRGKVMLTPSASPTEIWPNDIVLGFSHSASMPPNGDAATAINFVLKNPTGGAGGGARGAPAGALPPGVAGNVGWTVRMVQKEERGSGGDLMIVDRSEKTIITDNKSGAFISGIS